MNAQGLQCVSVRALHYTGYYESIIAASKLDHPLKSIAYLKVIENLLQSLCCLVAQELCENLDTDESFRIYVYIITRERVHKSMYAYIS